MRSKGTTLYALLIGIALCASVMSVHAATPGDSTYAAYSDVARRLVATGLRDGEAYQMLERLIAAAPRRLAGSPGASAATEFVQKLLREYGATAVHAEPCTVPRWVRGAKEEAAVLDRRGRPSYRLAVCALGGSVGTPANGITAEVIEVHSLKEVQQLGDAARGKIIFYNRPMNPAHFQTGQAYGEAVDQRSTGAIEAARYGGVAALVRSMTLAHDRVPHTGAMNYVDSIPKVPGIALSTVDADSLSVLLKKGPVRVRLQLSSKTLPDVPSANVMGEIRGSEHPEEVIVVGGHLDAWDTGNGAHDDGGGCVQAIEVLNLFRKLGLKPKRTVRAVLFMNEEFGLNGGMAYPVAPGRQGEKHVAAIESDGGVFAPRGFSVQGDSLLFARVLRWKPLFADFLADRFVRGHAGSDVSPLIATGVPGFGLQVENHRYFDYHHSANDTLDKVNPREIELGAIAEALLCYLIAQEGLSSEVPVRASPGL